MADPISSLSPKIDHLQEAIEASKKVALLPSIERVPPPFSRDTLSFSEQAHVGAIAAPTSTPKLTPPSESSHSSMLDLLKLQLLAEKRKEAADIHHENALENSIERQKKLFAAHAKKEAEYSTQMENVSSWERYRQIATFFSTALPFFGAAVAATGGPATSHMTYLLLAAGSSSLFNETMRQTNSWEKLFGYFVSDEKNKTLLASAVEKTVAISSSVLGAIGLGNFATSFQVTSTNFWTAIANPDDASNLALALKTISDGISTLLGIQSGVSEAKAHKIREEDQLYSGDLAAYKSNFDLLIKALKENSRSQEQMSKICHEALSSHQALIASTV